MYHIHSPISFQFILFSDEFFFVVQRNSVMNLKITTQNSEAKDIDLRNLQAFETNSLQCRDNIDTGSRSISFGIYYKVLTYLV